MASPVTSLLIALTAIAQSTSATAPPCVSPSEPTLVCEGASMDRIVVFIIDTSEGIDLAGRQRIASDLKKLVVPRKGSSAGFLLLYPNARWHYEPVQLAGECLGPAASALRTSVLLSAKEQQQAARRTTVANSTIGAAADHAIRKSQQGEAYSPLAETIIYLTKRPDFLRARTREIYLYSDMRQRSPECTVYGKPKDPAYFSCNKLWPADMKRATLHVLRFHRSPAIPGDAKLPSFWKDWVKRVNGQLTWEE